MSLHAILRAIQQDGQARVREIEQMADAQVQEIKSEARAESRRIREKARAKAFAPAAAERARILHLARLEALRVAGDAREGLVDKALDQARGRLASMRNNPAYPIVLRRLMEEALAELNVPMAEISQAYLQADQRDQALLEDILFDLGLELPVMFDLHIWGGVITKSEDGRVVVINTLEARLRRALTYLRRSLASLFEEGFGVTCPVSITEMPASER